VRGIRDRLKERDVKGEREMSRASENDFLVTTNK
jgi:hypothetical protein